MNVLKQQGSDVVERMDFSAPHERECRLALATELDASPLPRDQLLENLGLYLNTKTLTRVLFLLDFYRQGLNVSGQVFDLGTRWGQNMAVFLAARDMYEPYNRFRTINGFDTFLGFPEIHEKDGPSALNEVGNLPTVEGYAQRLRKLLALRQEDSQLSHLECTNVVEGDIRETLPKFLADHPHTVVSHAYFDLDLYEPTRVSLELLWRRAPIGAVFAFDELNDPDSPGETLAVEEVLGIGTQKIQRSPLTARISYIVKA